jgi:WD40 repeat protein
MPIKHIMMKYLLFVVTLFVFKNAPTFGQECKTFECALKKSETLLKNKNHDEALSNLDDAEDLAGNDENQKNQIRSLRKRITASMKQEKTEALRDKKEAIQAKEEAFKQTAIAKQEKDKAIIRGLTASAREILSSDRETAIRLADYATRVIDPPSEESIRCLHDVTSNTEIYNPQVRAIKIIRRYLHNSSISQCFFSKNGEKFVTCALEDSIIRVWLSNNGRNISVCKQLDLPLTQLSFSKNNDLIIFQESSGKTKVVNLIENKEVVRYTDTFPNGYRDVVFFKDRPILIQSNFDNSDTTINMIDILTHSKIKTFYRSRRGVKRFVIASNEQFAATLDNGNAVTIWDIEKNIVLQKIDNSFSEVRQIAFSPDNNIIALVKNRTIDLWDISANKLYKKLNGHANQIEQIVFSDDGKYLISSEAYAITKLWKLEWGQAIQTINTNHNPQFTIVLSKDSRNIMLYFGNEVKVFRTTIDMLDNEKNGTLNEEQRNGFGVPNSIKD